MKAKALLAVVFLLVSSLVLASCGGGVSKEKYNTAVAERDALEQKIAQAKLYYEVLAGFLTTGFGEQEPSGTQAMDLVNKIQATGDATLINKWQAVMDATDGDAELSDFFDYLVSKIRDALK